MSMKLGIQERQWSLLFWILFLPLLLNGVAIWMDIGAAGTLRLLSGTYQPSNPNLPLASLFEILSELLFNIALLGLLSWLVIFVSHKAFFQRQQLAFKIIESLLVVLFIAKVFEVATGFIMPFAWLPEFHDYLLGAPVSDFMMHWSRWLILPATALLLFVAMLFSRQENQKVRTQATPPIPYGQKRG